MGKEGDLSDFEWGVVAGARRAGPSSSDTGIITHHLPGLQREI